MSQGDDFSGDLPPIDPDLAAWLASDQPTAMPADVWTRLEARLAAEPAFAPSAPPEAGESAENVVSDPIDLAAERARRRGGRVLPILAGAAGLAIVGAVVLPSLRSADPAPVADGAPASQPLVVASAEPDGGSGADTPTVTAPQASDAQATPQPAATPANPEGAAAVVAEPVMPRAMVSTGTDYTMDALPAQVITLLADAGMSDGSAVATATPSVWDSARPERRRARHTATTPSISIRWRSSTKPCVTTISARALPAGSAATNALIDESGVTETRGADTPAVAQSP